ncbi:MAG: DUF819 family protein [candidate division KSB1 bacterium]|nr:DUF819 family protein [candidate division KSB1 bacterium]MDZ7272883.1 DUF819 family protein [candidate division KSB1 bacterium]MDZ7284094.1 DUF819 family protein [candidate division KSB1 bacterium]MDZ7297508.1 DUF819 family protein [candidate division KSB1 bacterium]MDZ7305644.1 DUF819 family protein [candidate division KSB1 bacterium]
MPLLQSPMAILAVCAGLCALVFWTSVQPWARRFFSIVPAILFVYFLPTLATTFGLLPAVSPLYDWMRDYLLPFSLFILMMTADLPAIMKVGPQALAMMLFGSLGVILGGVLAYVIFEKWLPPETWKGMAALAGSWIGGSGNFAAIKEAVSAPNSIIGPIIVVDTIVAYSWMGVLLFLANYQHPLDRLLGGSSEVLQDLNRRMKDYHESRQRPLAVPDLFLILALGFGGAVLGRSLAGQLHSLSHAAWQQNLPLIDSIFTEFTWLVIIISTAGILLSFTPLRQLEAAGASKVGYAALYLFLTSIGAKASLAGLLAAPVLLLAGVVWILFHIFVLFAGARLIRAPMFLVAIGSQANIGGPASAPIVAAAYYEAMAPAGVLMGVLGYLLGNYGGLLCALLLRLLAE